jgi:glycine cleavage system H lipoate-binding protein
MTNSVTVEGCELAGDVFYYPGHIWVRIEEGGTVRMGLDDFAQRLFGPAYSLKVPAPETQIKRSEACCRFTHQSGVSALFSPVSGKVKQANANLLLRPSLINRDPYGKGWIILVEPTDLKNCLKRSLYGERVRPWLAQEVEKLRLIINTVLNDGQIAPNTMTDGGLLTRQFLNGLSVEQTRRVISSFFPFPAVEETERNNAILVLNGR